MYTTLISSTLNDDMLSCLKRNSEFENGEEPTNGIAQGLSSSKSGPDDCASLMHKFIVLELSRLRVVLRVKRCIDMK